VNADGSGQRNLTRNAAKEQSPPTWSPNGRKIAFTSDREGDDEVYVMNANGTGQLRLTHNPGNEILPVWAPR
jgi:Tol biopolymer transport system component